MLSERLGKLHFWLFVIGFHLTFDVMHIPGMLGMPRRIYTYEPGRGWDTLNLIVTIGAFIQAVAILVFVCEPCRFLLEGSQGRQRSVGCMDARMVRELSAAGVQLRDDSGGRQPAAAVGSEASGRSGQPLRVRDATK